MTLDVLKAKLNTAVNECDFTTKASEYRELLDEAISYVYEQEKTERPVKATLLELIDSRTIENYVGDYEFLESLHFVRKLGINAEHNKKVRKKDTKLAGEIMTSFIGYVIDKSSPNLSNDRTAIFSDSVRPSYMSEADTRRIYIDMYLQEAGWDILDKENVAQPGKAGVEIRVEGMPNNKEEGFCDYVLYGRDGKPLAIVEAKKTSVSPEKGRHQVDLYAECMQKIYGYKPVLYYTNGYMIKIIDGIYPDRPVFAFHTIDELELMLQKRNRKPISDFQVNEEITNRPYQKMAVTAICERLNTNKRRGLLVMATGTGKTRVAISLTEILTRNNWIKNVLFLADRTTLVRQAKRNFTKYLNQTICELSGKEDKDFNARIMFSTYQTMINYIDEEDKHFSTGRFDLIIIDEAHRSVFNRYGSIFKYFDSFLIGLTATPKGEVGHSTYDLLQCEQDEPCFDYSMDEAIKDKYLVGFEVRNKESKLLRKGVTYGELSAEEKDQLDDYFGGIIPDNSYVIPSAEIYKHLFNKDTCVQVLEELMTKGLRVNNGETLGKTIIFAYNHKHAQLIVDTFKELYPQYPANTIQLVDYSISYSTDLVEKFSEDDEFRIAVSVDMLDTGVDIEACLNLVFFKPVYSLIKFIQMIGRGTRLCPDLYGPGKHKSGFLIFDYCGNFEFFNANPDGRVDDSQVIPLSQRLYEVRIDILHELQGVQYQEQERCREYYSKLKGQLYGEIAMIRSHNNRIAVREKMNYVDYFFDSSVWDALSKVDVQKIKRHIVPLMDSGLQGASKCLSFDLHMLKIELALMVDGSISRVAKEVKAVRYMAKTLMDEKGSINEVLQKAAELKEIVSDSFWTSSSVMDIEDKRDSLRDIMKYLEGSNNPTFDVDIKDDITDSDFVPDSTMIDIRTYREKVIDYLAEHSDNGVVKKIYNLEPITSEDLNELESVLWNELGTKEEYQETTNMSNLAAFVRSLIGVSQEVVNEKFGDYLSGNAFSLQQQEFVKMVINYVRENGDIEVSDMVNTEPFDSYDLNEMFGTSLPVLVTIVKSLHDVINAA